MLREAPIVGKLVKALSFWNLFRVARVQIRVYLMVC